MKYLDKEQTLWESKNKQLLLTTHRLRNVHNSIFGSTIKSIMLEELTSSELRTTRQYKYLQRAIVYFLSLNIAVYLLNHYLFQAEIFKFFFDEVHISPGQAGLIFYISIAIAIVNLVLFAITFKKTFYFYSNGITIDFQLRWLDFDERESFISKVEEAKNIRHLNLYGRDIKA